MFEDNDNKEQNVYNKVMGSVAECLSQACLVVGKQAGRLSESDDVDDQVGLGTDKMIEFSEFVHEPLGYRPPYSDDETAACFLVFIGKVQRLRTEHKELEDKWSNPKQFLQDVTALSVMTDQTWGSAYQSILGEVSDD
jgi:hypothetical protein